MNKFQEQFGVPLPEPVRELEEYVPLIQDHLGKRVSPDDPGRLLWYGPCFFWTDNWDLVCPTGHGIPRCPACGAPGFQIAYSDWMRQAEEYEHKGHPGYVEWMNANKEKCNPAPYELSRLARLVQQEANKNAVKVRGEAPE